MKTLLVLICLCFWVIPCLAEDYIIKIYGGNVVTVEHNGVIHAWGKGNQKETIGDDRKETNFSQTSQEQESEESQDPWTMPTSMLWEEISKLEYSQENEKAKKLAHILTQREIEAGDYYAASLAAKLLLKDMKMWRDLQQKALDKEYQEWEEKQ